MRDRKGGRGEIEKGKSACVRICVCVCVFGHTNNVTLKNAGIILTDIHVIYHIHRYLNNYTYVFFKVIYQHYVSLFVVAEKQYSSKQTLF